MQVCDGVFGLFSPIVVHFRFGFRDFSCMIAYTRKMLLLSASQLENFLLNFIFRHFFLWKCVACDLNQIQNTILFPKNQKFGYSWRKEQSDWLTMKRLGFCLLNSNAKRFFVKLSYTSASTSLDGYVNFSTSRNVLPHGKTHWIQSIKFWVVSRCFSILVSRVYVCFSLVCNPIAVQFLIWLLKIRMLNAHCPRTIIGQI